MIKSIFIPSMVGTYAVFERIIIGCEVTGHELRITKIKARGEKRSLEDFFTVALEKSETVSFFDALKSVVAGLADRLGSYDQFEMVLPGSLAVFQEVQMPFSDLAKIKKIVPYEIEKSLPFPLHEAYIDAIITEQQGASTTVLAVACKRDLVDEYCTIFREAGISIDRVTIDLIEWYGFITTVPEYKEIQEPYILLDGDQSSVRILVMKDQKLIGLRYLNRGIQDALVKAGLTHDKLPRFGFHEPAVQAALQPLMNEIKFTIASLAKKHDVAGFKRLLLAGMLPDAPDACDYMSAFLDIPAEACYAHKIIHTGFIYTPHQKGVPSGFEVSLSAALASQTTGQFNLYGLFISEKEDRVAFWQLVVTAVFSALLLCMVFGAFIFARYRFVSEISASEKETLDKLKKVFNIRKASNLESALQESRYALAKEKNIWFALSTGNRFSYLTYLQELFSRIDRVGLGLDLKKLSIKNGDGTNDDIVLLEGSVRDYEALRKFQESLEDSKLFKKVPKLQEIKFNVSLAIDKSAVE